MESVQGRDRLGGGILFDEISLLDIAVRTSPYVQMLVGLKLEASEWGIKCSSDHSATFDTS